jgi:predicted nucleotidyltransferase
MKTHLRIQLPEKEIASFCKRWKIEELSAFGSVVREDFGPESDVDLLVRFSPDARWTLFDMARMRGELRTLLGREVDLVSRRGVESSRNPIRREAILSSAEVIYAA